ncbi:MAG: NAD(P)H-hydrate dehydratase [Lachnospiraceae bacterium]|nr:NAD(P)H-hydrate dehydratase [Lachnospiraceae bacterium]
MIPILSVENMRNSDAATIAGGIPGRELMLRAGKGIYAAVSWKAPVAVICGSGNNAGDGYVIASYLHDDGIPCEIILLSEKFSGDGAFYYQKCKEAGITVTLWQEGQSLRRFATIADCILGTGFHGSVRGNVQSVIEEINKSGAYVVSVDINSGLNGDTGMTDLCVHSDLTVSVGGFQPGHFLQMAKDVMKERVNIDIGIKPAKQSAFLIEEEDIAPIFRPRKNHSNKGTYGYVALIGGSEKYSGAIRLAGMANAAMRCGAGVAKLAVPRCIARDVLPLILESTAFPLSDEEGEIAFAEEEIQSLTTNVKTVAFGMGIGTGKGAERVLLWLLENYKGRLIVDADGLTLLAALPAEKIRSSACSLILTPHIKEFSRLTGESIDEILAAPVAKAQAYASDMGVTLLLKGPATIVTDGRTTYLTDRGCAGMATAGSGDVLSGVLSAVLSFGGDCLLATAAGAYINGRAGELAQEEMGSVSMIASDTVAKIPKVIKQLEDAAKS